MLTSSVRNRLVITLKLNWERLPPHKLSYKYTLYLLEGSLKRSELRGNMLPPLTIASLPPLVVFVAGAVEIRLIRGFLHPSNTTIIATTAATAEPGLETSVICRDTWAMCHSPGSCVLPIGSPIWSLIRPKKISADGIFAFALMAFFFIQIRLYRFSSQGLCTVVF